MRPATATPGDFDELPPAARPLGGTVVLAVTPNSPAQKAGLQPNDVVVEIQGRSLRDSLDLMREIGLEGPNRKVQLKVWRPRERKFLTRTATLGKWPVQNDADVIATSERYPAWRGVRVDYPTARARYLRSGGVVHFEDAVLVVDVDAERNGLRLQPGDFVSRVGETPVSTPEEFLKAVRGLGNRKAVLETIDGRTIEIDP